MQKLLIGKLYRFIFITGIVQWVNDFKLLIGHTEGHLIRLRFDFATVTDIADLIVKASPLSRQQPVALSNRSAVRTMCEIIIYAITRSVNRIIELLRI